MTNTEQKSLVGKYEFVSPYHKGRKMLPFNIISVSLFGEYPVHVETVEYRGWTRKPHSGNYNLATINDFIDSGFITKK